MNTTIKAILIIVLLLAIIAGLAGYTLNLLYTSAGKLENQINLIEEHIKEEQWAKAKQNLSLILTEWENISRQWAILIDHTEIDNIEEALLKVQGYIETNNASLSLTELNVLKGYIKHIPEKESLTFKNLF